MSAKTKAFIYIILAGICWGTSSIFVHVLAPFGYSSLQMVATRGTVAAISMMIYVLANNKNLYQVKPRELVLFILGGVAVYLTSSAYYSSMQLTSVSTAVILMYTSPVLVMIYSVAFMGERLTKLKLISVVCMFVGCALVSGVIGGMKFDTFGILLGFGSSIAYTAYNIFTKIQMKNKSNPVSASMYCFIAMSIVSLFFSEPVEYLSLTAQNPLLLIPILIALGIMTCFLPYFLYTLALKSLPVGTASALGIVEPLAATIFSITLLGEQVSIASVSGIILILVAVYMLSKSE